MRLFIRLFTVALTLSVDNCFQNDFACMMFIMNFIAGIFSLVEK